MDDVAGAPIYDARQPATDLPMSPLPPTPPPPTSRLEFRLWRHADLDLALALWGDARVTALIDARGQLDTDQVRARLEAEIALHRRHGVQYWPVFLRSSGAHVGACGLRPRDGAQGVLEIGFHLRPEWWGRGLAGEAARGVIDFAFEQLGAAALFAGHNPKNAASRRLLERLGFRHSHDELYPATGLHHPSYLLTSSAYRAQRRAPSRQRNASAT